ncbi:hypothetical protein [Fusobacterium sp. IOR10]|uniref:hypothetical protein n=1 Tax=Fusobacterium sp. IOR10 TaxID=2665157 RepID=UPI0013D0CA40|nr:hypothetical protein [Fusobacterium sp. IOR10]
MGISRTQFREAVNKFYTKNDLYKLFKVYFIDLIAEGYIGLNMGIFEVSLITEESNKSKFLELMDQVFLKKENFLNAFSSFPKDVQEVFEKIAWDGKYIIKERDLYFKKGREFSNDVQLKDKYRFFKYGYGVKKEEYLYLDNDIVRWYREFLPRIKECYIYPSEKYKDLNRDSNEKIILEDIVNYFKFFADGKIELSSSGKILKSSKSSMCKYCNIKEYYQDEKDLSFLKTETIALFFFLLKDEYLNISYLKASNIKNIVNDFLDGKIIKDKNSVYIRLYLNYLKGVNKILKNNNEIKRGITTIKEALMEMPDNKMVNVDNIINYIIYNDKFIEVLDVKSVYDNIYINEANYERTKITSYFNYKNYIIEPFIKSVLFILSALGVIEIFYTLPSNKNSLYLKHGYLSKFEGIKAIKFTELGRYIFDRVDTYAFKEEEEGIAVLEEDRLIITLIGDSPIKILFLESIGTKISSNKYKVSENSFLKKIKMKDQYYDKVNEFKEKISLNFSEIWVEFFEKMEKRVNGIEVINDYKVLKLKDDKELINFIVKNKEIGKLILKAENFHILIKKENIEKFSEILKENGYYFEDM